MTQPTTQAERDTLFVAVGATATRLQSQILGEQGERAQTQTRGVLAELRRRAGESVLSVDLGLSAGAPPARISAP